MVGMVIKSTGSWYQVLDKVNNSIYNCQLKGKFRIKGLKTTNPIAVGDQVHFTPSENPDIPSIINHIKDRKNYIIRKSINLSKQYHIIASNLDQLLLVITLKAPFTSTLFIDRYLVTAEAYNIPTTIVCNKTDLLNKVEQNKLNNLQQRYQKIGYNFIQASVKETHNIHLIKDLLQDKTTLISGHSGVGKSSLLNLIEPSLNLKTSTISQAHSTGKHTTTFAHMHTLTFGGYLIDTPGIRSFSIVDLEKESLYHYFPEFFKESPQCKFHNCLHIKEPGCSIKLGIETEKISIERYKSYLSIYHSDDEKYRIEDYL